MPQKTYSRPPAHANKSGPYIHNAHSKKTDKILSHPITDVCQKCAEKLEWRKKYRKYRGLKTPAKCRFCMMYNVHAAYHVCCKGCAAKEAERRGKKEVCEICLSLESGTGNESTFKANLIKDHSKVAVDKAKSEAEVLSRMRERERRGVLRVKAKEDKAERVKVKRLAGGLSAEREEGESEDDSGSDGENDNESVDYSDGEDGEDVQEGDVEKKKDITSKQYVDKRLASAKNMAKLKALHKLKLESEEGNGEDDGDEEDEDYDSEEERLRLEEEAEIRQVRADAKLRRAAKAAAAAAALVESNEKGEENEETITATIETTSGSSHDITISNLLETANGAENEMEIRFDAVGGKGSVIDGRADDGGEHFGGGNDLFGCDSSRNHPTFKF